MKRRKEKEERKGGKVKHLEKWMTLKGGERCKDEKKRIFYLPFLNLLSLRLNSIISPSLFSFTSRYFSSSLFTANSWWIETMHSISLFPCLKKKIKQKNKKNIENIYIDENITKFKIWGFWIGHFITICDYGLKAHFRTYRHYISQCPVSTLD